MCPCGRRWVRPSRSAAAGLVLDAPATRRQRDDDLPRLTREMTDTPPPPTPPPHTPLPSLFRNPHRLPRRDEEQRTAGRSRAARRRRSRGSTAVETSRNRLPPVVFDADPRSPATGCPTRRRGLRATVRRPAPNTSPSSRARVWRAAGRGARRIGRGCLARRAGVGVRRPLAARDVDVLAGRVGRERPDPDSSTSAWMWFCVGPMNSAPRSTTSRAAGDRPGSIRPRGRAAPTTDRLARATASRPARRPRPAPMTSRRSCAFAERPTRDVG